MRPAVPLGLRRGAQPQRTIPDCLGSVGRLSSPFAKKKQQSLVLCLREGHPIFL